MVRRTALGLTPRQELYLRGMCNGDLRKEVATNAGRSRGGVAWVLGEAYRALKVRNRGEACYVLGTWDALENATQVLTSCNFRATMRKSGNVGYNNETPPVLETPNGASNRHLV